MLCLCEKQANNKAGERSMKQRNKGLCKKQRNSGLCKKQEQ